VTIFIYLTAIDEIHIVGNAAFAAIICMFRKGNGLSDLGAGLVVAHADVLILHGSAGGDRDAATV
jgi:hypothetical protein